jgi:hypothetical protein
LFAKFLKAASITKVFGLAEETADFELAAVNLGAAMLLFVLFLSVVSVIAGIPHRGRLDCRKRANPLMQVVRKD